MVLRPFIGPEAFDHETKNWKALENWKQKYKTAHAHTFVFSDPENAFAEFNKP